MRALLAAFTHHIDRRLSGCPKPGLLSPRERLQGWAVLEKVDGNIHVHILASCRDTHHQRMTALFLFEALDTVPDDRKDPRDGAWQQDAWECLVNCRSLKDDDRTRKHSPFLQQLLPGGTAMVQMVWNHADLTRVAEYVTKELSRSSVAAARASDYWNNKSDFRVVALSEFHSDLGTQKPASRIRVIPKTGAQKLDLDDLHPWKWRGRRLQH
jgi:hypothetical protein